MEWWSDGVRKLGTSAAQKKAAGRFSRPPLFASESTRTAMQLKGWPNRTRLLPPDDAHHGVGRSRERVECRATVGGDLPVHYREKAVHVRNPGRRQGVGIGPAIVYDICD